MERAIDEVVNTARVGKAREVYWLGIETDEDADPRASLSVGRS
jgi:hypothetical protein